MLRLVRECDLFRKLPAEHNEVEAPDSLPSLVLRVISVVLISMLGLSETYSFLTPVRKQKFDIDMGETAIGTTFHNVKQSLDPGSEEVLFPSMFRGAPRKMRVVLDMTVHGFPCMDLSLDYQDVMGTRAVDVRNTIFKQRLDKNGTAVGETTNNDPKSLQSGNASSPSLKGSTNTNKSCGSCYAALPEGECCNTCSDVLYAYRLKRWALPRIEDIEQCRHDGTAKSAYQPPQIIHLGDYSSEDYLPKFTKLSALSSSVKEPRITTPFRMNMSFTPLKPLVSGSPLILNFSDFGFGDGFDSGDDDYDDFFGLSKEKKNKTKILTWPSCVQRNVIIHGYDIGEALMIDLSKYGATKGCWNNDCTETDKFACDDTESCAEMCGKVEACQWWTWGDEEGVKKCWIRTGKHGREKRYGFSSGARGCLNSTTMATNTEKSAVKNGTGEVKAEATAGKTEEKKEDTAADTQPRRMMSLDEGSETGTVQTQPRRLMSFEDDFDFGLSRPLPMSYGYGYGHMPMFGSGFNSRENDMRKQQQGESCRIYGYFDTNKVPGNFHIGTHGTMAPSYLSYFDEPAPAEKNMMHTINHLAFVDIVTNKTLAEKQPLDGFESPKAFTFQYYITVNPATVLEKGRKNQEGYQYRSGSFVTNELIGPAVFFRYDIDPIRVTYYTESVTSTRWLTNMCAIIGGCIALSAMLEQLLDAGVATAMGKDS